MILYILIISIMSVLFWIAVPVRSWIVSSVFSGLTSSGISYLMLQPHIYAGGLIRNLSLIFIFSFILLFLAKQLLKKNKHNPDKE